jgi:antirestriction protein ArdC
LQLDPQVQADPQEHFAFPQPDMMMMTVERVSTKKKFQEAIDHTHTHTHTLTHSLTHSQREEKTNERGARETKRQRKRNEEINLV